MGLSSDSLTSFLWIPCEQLSDYSLSISRKLFINFPKTIYQFPDYSLAILVYSLDTFDSFDFQ